MPVDIEMIRRTYARMSNRELMDIVTEEGAGLTPEAIEIAQEEIRKRNLSPEYLKSLDAQNNWHSTQEINYISYAKQLPCPFCGQTGATLFINQIANSRLAAHFGCAACLNKLNREIAFASLLRMYSPLRLLKTPFIFAQNFGNISRNNAGRLEEALLATFVRRKAGILSAHESYPDQRPIYLKKLQVLEEL